MVDRPRVKRQELEGRVKFPLGRWSFQACGPWKGTHGEQKEGNTSGLWKIIRQANPNVHKHLDSMVPLVKLVIVLQVVFQFENLTKCFLDIPWRCKSKRNTAIMTLEEAMGWPERVTPLQLIIILAWRDASVLVGFRLSRFRCSKLGLI